MQRFSWKHLTDSGEEVVAVYLDPASLPWEIEDVRRIEGNLDVPMASDKAHALKRAIESTAGIMRTPASFREFCRHHSLVPLEVLRQPYRIKATGVTGEVQVAVPQDADDATVAGLALVFLGLAAVAVELGEVYGMSGELLVAPVLVAG